MPIRLVPEGGIDLVFINSKDAVQGQTGYGVADILRRGSVP
jgi:hypothetical protein